MSLRGGHKDCIMEDKKQDLSKYSYRKPEFYNYFRWFFQWLVTHVFFMIRFKLFYRLEVLGKENVPNDNKYIVTPNHLSTLDPPLIAGIMKRPVAFMAKKELFKNIFMRWWLDWLGAFAVDRDKLGVSTIKTALSICKTPWVFGIFPQGTRQTPGKIENVTKGFASLAKKTGCGILPIAITGSQDAVWVPFKGKIIVKIGKLIPCDNDVQVIVDEWIKAVTEMTGFEYVPAEGGEDNNG